jgi:hypothetical protein
LLTDEEKQNFIGQIKNSEVKQFTNILQQAKNLIREKRKDEGNGHGSGNHNHDSHDIPDNSENQGDNSQNIPDLPDLPLLQSQTQAEQEIEKLLKDSGISSQQLDQDQKKLLQGID